MRNLRSDPQTVPQTVSPRDSLRIRQVFAPRRRESAFTNLFDIVEPAFRSEILFGRMTSRPSGSSRSEAPRCAINIRRNIKRQAKNKWKKGTKCSDRFRFQARATNHGPGNRIVAFTTHARIYCDDRAKLDSRVGSRRQQNGLRAG